MTHQHNAAQAPTPCCEQAIAASPLDDALAAHHAAHQAYAAEPGSAELLAAYVEARRLLQAARHAAIADIEAQQPISIGGGPIVVTPVIEWWTTTVEF